MHSYMVTDCLAVVFLPSLGTLLCLNEGKDDFIFYFFFEGGDIYENVRTSKEENRRIL